MRREMSPLVAIRSVPLVKRRTGASAARATPPPMPAPSAMPPALIAIRISSTRCRTLSTSPSGRATCTAPSPSPIVSTRRCSPFTFTSSKRLPLPVAPLPRASLLVGSSPRSSAGLRPAPPGGRSQGGAVGGDELEVAGRAAIGGRVPIEDLVDRGWPVAVNAVVSQSGRRWACAGIAGVGGRRELVRHRRDPLAQGLVDLAAQLAADRNVREQRS